MEVGGSRQRLVWKLELADNIIRGMLDLWTACFFLRIQGCLMLEIRSSDPSWIAKTSSSVMGKKGKNSLVRQSISEASAREELCVRGAYFWMLTRASGRKNSESCTHRKLQFLVVYMHCMSASPIRVFSWWALLELIYSIGSNLS
jgi:hypothetical protein